MKPFGTYDEADEARLNVAHRYEWPRKSPPWPTARTEEVSDGWFVVLNPVTPAYRPSRIYVLDANGEEWGLDTGRPRVLD